METAQDSEVHEGGGAATAELDDLEREMHWRAEGPELWYLRLQNATRLPSWALGLLATLLLLAFFAAVGALPLSLAALSPERMAGLGSSLFFSLSIGFLLGASGHIFPAAVTDLERLRTASVLDDAEYDTFLAGLTRFPSRGMVVSALLALVGGAAHMTVLYDSQPLVNQASPMLSLFAGTVGTVGIWFMMFQISTPLMHNARLISLLGTQVRVDLYDPDRLAPFGASALRPTLFLIALQSLYPLLALDAQPVDPGVYIGLAVSLVLVLGLFFLPLRGVRERIRAARGDALEALDERIAAQADSARISDAGTSDQALGIMEGLLALRERIAHVSVWPLGSSGTRRMLLYIVIPPIAWATAILLEVAIERSL